jgi:hypothetical protein
MSGWAASHYPNATRREIQRHCKALSHIQIDELGKSTVVETYQIHDCLTGPHDGFHSWLGSLIFCVWYIDFDLKSTDLTDTCAYDHGDLQSSTADPDIVSGAPLAHLDQQTYLVQDNLGYIVLIKGFLWTCHSGQPLTSAFFY